MEVASTAPYPVHKRRFEFSGRAGEYFGIWIVNLLLTILTLGIYSAWAKVRRQRYFYGNTTLDGHNLEYHARPISILIGRLIVVGLLILYQVLVTLTPMAVILLLPYIFALPWLINRALRFNARVTTWRNIRFDFEGGYWRAFLVYLVMPVIAAASLGLLAPVASNMNASYIGSRLRYGSVRFRTEPDLGLLYRNFFAAIGLVLLALLVLGGIAVLAFFAASAGRAPSADFAATSSVADLFASAGVLAASFLFYVVIGVAYLFYRAGVRNIAYCGTSLAEQHHLFSDMGRLRFAWIMISNVIVILLTLGLMTPWASVRTWRYKTEHTGVESTAPLAGIVDRMIEEGTAAPAEFFDIEGVDLGV